MYVLRLNQSSQLNFNVSVFSCSSGWEEGGAGGSGRASGRGAPVSAAEPRCNGADVPLELRAAAQAGSVERLDP